MRIALLHYSAPPIVGGVESVMAHHAALMSEAGHQVTVFCGRGEKFNENVAVVVLPILDSLNKEVLAVKAALDKGIYADDFDILRDRIKQELIDHLAGFDVLIAHNVGSLHKNLPLSAAVHDLCQLPGSPRLILWHHDLAWTTSRYRSDLHDGYPWQLLREAWPCAGNVVISRTRQKELSRLYHLPIEDIRVVPNGVDLYTFHKFEARTIGLIEKADLLSADPLFLLPVRLTPRKNIELALHILAALKSHYPHVKLLITGPEGPHNPANRFYRDRLMELRHQLGLEDAAVFIAEIEPSFLPDEVISDFYHLADALLFPSYEEGFGIPMLEAGFTNLPVFCSDIPVLRELGGDYLCYFDPKGEADEIAAMIAGELEKESSTRWSRHVKHKYTWQSIYSRFIEPLLVMEVKA